MNQTLDEVLHEVPLDEAALQQIVIKRANLVESLLNSMDQSQLTCFARHELTSNDAILAAVDVHKKTLSIELAKVNKASKAIKKYHQV